MVRIGLVPSRFIAPTAWTASPLTSRVLVQDKGAGSVEENTTLETRVSSARVASSSVVVSSASVAPDWVANPDINRYVFAPMRTV